MGDPDEFPRRPVVRPLRKNSSERSPVDRHSRLRMEKANRLGCAGGVEMARPEPWAPAGNRQQRNVNGPDVAHFREELGIACEVDARPALDDVAEGRNGWRKRSPARLVLRVRGANPDGTEREFLPNVELHDPREAAPLHERADAVRHDDR